MMVPPQIPPDPVAGSYGKTSTLHGNSPVAAAVPPTIRVVPPVFTPQVHVDEPPVDGTVDIGGDVVVGGAVVGAAVVADPEPATTVTVHW
jgi:hypothetical protein